MTTKAEIDHMKADIKSNRDEIIELKTDRGTIIANQNNNYKTLQRIEGKQDKFTYLFIGTSLSLVITLIVLGINVAK
jgi:TolA-binding protein